MTSCGTFQIIKVLSSLTQQKQKIQIKKKKQKETSKIQTPLSKIFAILF